MESDDRTFVYWMETARPRDASCKPRRSTSSPVLAERLFDRVDTVVLTSATLAVAGSFEFARAASRRSSAPAR